MSEKDKWEIRFKFFGTIFAGISILVTVVLYVDGNAKALEREHELIRARAQVEYDRRLWDETRLAYKELAETLGSIAADIDATGTISSDLRRAFGAAYWGAIFLEENEGVRNEMVMLRNDIGDFEAGRITSDKIKLRIGRIVSASAQHIVGGANVVQD